MSKKIITESEYEIMKILWSKNTPLSLGEILSELGDKWVRNTVGTMLTRLARKGLFLTKQKEKAIYIMQLLTKVLIVLVKQNPFYPSYMTVQSEKWLPHFMKINK